MVDVLSEQGLLNYDANLDSLSQYMNARKRNFSTNYNPTSIDMVRATPNSVLSNDFFMTPAWQLYYGTETPGVDDPRQRFFTDPGYEFSQEEGIRQLLRNHSARGLLESGRSLRDVLGYSQNLADQTYQRWMGQQLGLYSDYQNRLQGLMGMGPSVNGAQNAYNLGSNLGNLFVNQGVFGGSGMLNTGAAQAGNLMNAASIGAQIASANAAAGFSGGDTGGRSLSSSSTGLGGYF